MAFAAHRAGHGSPFLEFDTLRVGDEVVLEQRRVRWTYRLLTAPRIVPVDATWVLRPSTGPLAHPDNLLAPVRLEQADVRPRRPHPRRQSAGSRLGDDVVRDPGGLTLTQTVRVGRLPVTDARPGAAQE